MYKEDKIIVRYAISDLGDYSIDEDMILYRGRIKIQNCLTLSDAKKTIKEIVNRDRLEKIEKLRTTISNLDSQSTNIEVFRLKNNFN